MPARVYESKFERHLSTVRTGNPWTPRGRGAVRWSCGDFVPWENGRAILMRGQLTLGGLTEEQAREWVASGKLPRPRAEGY